MTSKDGISVADNGAQGSMETKNTIKKKHEQLMTLYMDDQME